MPPARHYWGCREEDERRAGTKNADSETPSPFVVDRTKPHGVLGVKRENARRKRVPDHLPPLENDDKIVDGQQQRRRRSKRSKKSKKSKKSKRSKRSKRSK